MAENALEGARSLIFSCAGRCGAQLETRVQACADGTFVELPSSWTAEEVEEEQRVKLWCSSCRPVAKA